MGKQWKQWQSLLFWAPTSLQMVTAAMKLRHLLLGRKVMTNLDSILKSKDITLPTQVCVVQLWFFQWEFGHKEGCVPSLIRGRFFTV